VFRRVRFGVEGKFFRDFIYEMRFDFGGSNAEGNGVTQDFMNYCRPLLGSNMPEPHRLRAPAVAKILNR
jgi:hypothetical protein